MRSPFLFFFTSFSDAVSVRHPFGETPAFAEALFPFAESFRNPEKNPVCILAGVSGSIPNIAKFYVNKKRIRYFEGKRI